MQIPKSLAIKLMDESESFRQFVIDTLFGDTVIEDIIAICKRNPNNKIGAIKELRDYSVGREESFLRSGLVNGFNTDCIGLADAKRLVERHGNY